MKTQFTKFIRSKIQRRSERGKRMGGMSLIEILIVITIFAILGVIIARSIILSLQGSKKSEGMVAARENLDYAMSIMERQIRGSKEILSTSTATQINYIDQYDKTSLFVCNPAATDSYVASGSASLASRITSDSVKISACSFTYEDEDGDLSTPPKYVDIYLQARPAKLVSSQSSLVTVQNRIYIRNYQN